MKKRLLQTISVGMAIVLCLGLAACTKAGDADRTDSEGEGLLNGTDSYSDTTQDPNLEISLGEVEINNLNDENERKKGF